MTEQSERGSSAGSGPTKRQRESVREFVGEHGKPARAVIENLGRAGVRVVLVGTDGAVGDVLVADRAAAEALIAADEDVQTADWDAETVNATAIGAEHRRRMGRSLTRR